MSKLFITSDLHLGHRNIHKYRTEFPTAEEHHEIIFDNLACSVNKRDSVYFLGDIAFTKEWLARIATLKVRHKVLVCGNHDLEHGIKMRDMVETYDAVYSLWSKRNYWFTHAPIHPQELRDRKANIHGHLHGNLVLTETGEIDPRYINACVEHTNWKPISFQNLTMGE